MVSLRISIAPAHQGGIIMGIDAKVETWSTGCLDL
jgi:hypothetical protein